MLLKPPTADELQNTFDDVLTAIMAGDLAGCPTDTGLSAAVKGSLDAVVTARDKPAAASRAKTALAAYLKRVDAPTERSQRTGPRVPISNSQPDSRRLPHN